MQTRLFSKDSTVDEPKGALTDLVACVSRCILQGCKLIRRSLKEWRNKLGEATRPPGTKSHELID